MGVGPLASQLLYYDVAPIYIYISSEEDGCKMALKKPKRSVLIFKYFKI